MQKYAVAVTKIEGDRKSRSVSASTKFSANQKVFYLGMLRDFGNRHSGLPFHRLPFLPIAERLVKSIELYKEGEHSFERYIQRFGDTNRDELSSSEFRSACQEVRLTEIYSNHDLEAFLHHIGTLVGQKKSQPMTLKSGTYDHPFANAA